MPYPTNARQEQVDAFMERHLGAEPEGPQRDDLVAVIDRANREFVNAGSWRDAAEHAADAVLEYLEGLD